MNVLEAIKTRRSVREYTGKPIPDQVMVKLRQSLRYAPSACNFQPWIFIMVTDPSIRQQVSHAANEQNWMAEAPLIVVGCGLPDHAYTRMGGQYNSVDIDVAIALDHLMLCAVTEGLGTCWIGSFKEDEVMRILNIPDCLRVVAMTPVGYPANTQLIHPVNEAKRKSEDDVFRSNTFD